METLFHCSAASFLWGSWVLLSPGWSLTATLTVCSYPAVLAEEGTLSYLLPGCDRDTPYAVHVGRVAVGVLRRGEVACAVL